MTLPASHQRAGRVMMAGHVTNAQPSRKSSQTLRAAVVSLAQRLETKGNS